MFGDLEGTSNRTIDVDRPEEFDNTRIFDDLKVISNESIDFDELMIQKCAVIFPFSMVLVALLVTFVIYGSVGTSRL